MADIKSLLKEARKLIDDKKYKEAQECCKDILRKDKQNYFALVLLGKSLQDSDQAPLAYQKAIASKRDNPLAWQGLAHYYESKGDYISNSKLLTIYSEMLYLPMDEEKILEAITKLGQLGCSLRSSEAVSSLGNFMNKNEDKKIYAAAETQLIQLLKADVPCEQENIQLIVQLLTKININNTSESIELMQCKVILQMNDLNSAVEELINLPLFTSNAAIRDFICKSLCIKYVENMSFNGLDIEKYIDNITLNIENLKYPSLLKSMVAYDQCLYLEAYKQCVPLINYQEADVTEATFIIKCTVMLKKWSVTQKLATNFITKAKTEKFVTELRKFLFMSLAKQQKWKPAIANAKLIPLHALNIEEKVCLAECYIETKEPADNIMEELKETEQSIQLQALLLLKQGKYEEAVDLLQQNPENALLIFYLGKAYWELKKYDQCLMNLLKAAKLNPDHAETFLYLGHFYCLQKKDLDKAKKCYEKAYYLNNIDVIIAKSLSDTYIKLQQSDADFELLITLSNNLTVLEPWIPFRLGLHYLNKRDWENAIINFRNVIKSNQNDTTAFECLADAYYSRGSYTSALRAYNKVMTMDPNKASHCLSKIGYIHCLLTQYDEAIITFEKVFKIDPNSHLALKGIAETWIKIAKKKITAKLHGSARDCAQNAINYIIKSIKTQNHFTCFWKLLADTLLFITKLPNQYAYVYMPDLSNAESKLVKKEKIEIFPQAIACYSHIAKQRQQVTSYDLAYAYFCYYQESQKVVNANLSYNLITVCIKERPNCWRNWNLLGKICLLIKRNELSQHCFIKALQVSRKGSVAKIWCNLGTLYLKLNLYKLSNYCFWRGQSTMPSYPQSWIGQAFIAEAIREEEAMDLFRHAARLGYHPESALGYADWVCRTLKDNKYSEDAELKYVIEGLHAIPYAMDLVEWLCNYEPNNACAYNILGVLQERSGQLMPAMKSYENAFKNGDDNQKNIVLLNIGRLLVRLEKYEEAVKVYKAITEASFNSTIGLALALFKNGKYEESYSVYDTALHWLCRDENEKADVLVAMAGIVYMYKGMDDAKTILFHSIQTSQAKPTPHSLYSICALGLKHSDQSMSKLAASELKKFDKDTQYGYDIGFLKSYFYVLDGNVNEAIKVLSDSIHDHPSNAHLWFCMAQYCLSIPDSKAKAASNCAQKALCVAKYGDININFANIIASASIAEHLAGDHKKGLTLAKDGLHMYPNQAEIWAALLFSLLSDSIWTEKKSWILTAAGHMRRHLNISRPLSRWASLLEKKINR